MTVAITHLDPELEDDGYNQMTMAEAKDRFDYRDGHLYFKNGGTGRERHSRRVGQLSHDRRGYKYWMTTIASPSGPTRYKIKLLVWNWHFGKTDTPLIWKDGDTTNNRIENLEQVRRATEGVVVADIVKPLHKNSGLATQIPAIPCPCCNQPVRMPTLEIIIDAYQLPPQEARVLRAVWRGKGMPVMPERIFDALYEDDPDGGPPPARMYANFQWALSHLRKHLEGSGISVESAGYRRGYRLKLGA